MNRRNILKLIAFSPIGLLLSYKRKESEWEVIKSKGTLEKYIPYKKYVETVFGYKYEINVVLTKSILIPYFDGIDKIWEMNYYGNLVKILATCYCGDKDRTDCIVHKYQSEVLEDGKVTSEMYNNFIVKVENHFTKGICKEYNFYEPFNTHSTVIKLS